MLVQRMHQERTHMLGNDAGSLPCRRCDEAIQPGCRLNPVIYGNCKRALPVDQHTRNLAQDPWRCQGNDGARAYCASITRGAALTRLIALYDCDLPPLSNKVISSGKPDDPRTNHDGMARGMVHFIGF